MLFKKLLQGMHFISVAMCSVLESGGGEEESQCAVQ